MTTITIPPEAVEAAASAYTAVIYCGDGTTREFHEAIEAAILAALESWPGMRIMVDIDTGDDAAIKLPLPQEASDE